MFKRFFSAILVSGAVLGLVPSLASAYSIGISSGVVDREVYQGMTVPETVYVSHSDTKVVADFDITTSGDPIIDLHGLTEVQIPLGLQGVSVPYDLITDNLPLGEYDGQIIFTLRQLFASEDANANKVQFASALKIHLKVTESPDTSVAISVKDYPLASADLRVRDVAVLQTPTADGHNLHLSWKIANEGTRPLKDVIAQVVMTQHGNTYQQETVAVSEVVPAGGFIEQSKDFPVRFIDKGGVYNFEVKIEESKGTASSWVIQPLFRKQLTIVLSGLVAMLVLAGVVLAIDRGWLKLGHHRT